MMKTRMFPFLFMCTALLMFSGCIGCQQEKSTEEEVADKINDATKELTDGIEDASKNLQEGLGDAMKNLEDAVNNLQDEAGTKKEPVNFRKLKELLPESIEGFDRTSSSGESSGTMGIKVSNAKAKYEKDNRRVDIEITDAGGVGMALMGMAAWSMVEIDKESDSGFERTTTFKGQKAFEKCNKRSCEFSVIVAKRYFVVAKERSDNPSIDDLHDMVEDIVEELEDMKDAEG